LTSLHGIRAHRHEVIAVRRSQGTLIERREVEVEVDERLIGGSRAVVLSLEGLSAVRQGGRPEGNGRIKASVLHAWGWYIRALHKLWHLRSDYLLRCCLDVGWDDRWATVENWHGRSDWLVVTEEMPRVMIEGIVELDLVLSLLRLLLDLGSSVLKPVVDLVQRDTKPLGITLLDGSAWLGLLSEVCLEDLMLILGQTWFCVCADLDKRPRGLRR